MTAHPAAADVATSNLSTWRVHLGEDPPVNTPSLRQRLATGTVCGEARRTFAGRAASPLLEVDGTSAAGAELLEQMALVSRLLDDAGARGASRVLVALPTSVALVTTYLGVLDAGCSAILASPAATGPELAGMIRVGAPSHAIVSPDVYDRLGDAVERGRAVERGQAVEGGRGAERAILATMRPATSEGEARPRESEAVLAFTSGTTGEPKGVPLSHANLLASIRAAMAAWRWDGSDVVVHALPLFHQHGLSSIHALATGGGRTVIRSRFDPDELLAVVAAQGASILLGVPAMYQRLVSSARHSDVASLRLVVSGSAPLPPQLFGEIAELTGLQPLERYGTTESGLDVSNPYEGPRRPGAVGLPLPGVELRIADLRTQAGTAAAPDGDVGEIQFRGPQVFDGYLGPGGHLRPSGCLGPSEGVFAAGGWFRTGDVGCVDPATGTLAITGRTKEVVITGGMNVYPREVELVLERHDAVQAVAVAGVPSPRWGEAVCAFVVPRPGAEPDRAGLVELCRASLAPYKHPKQYLIVDELPRNAVGKVMRSELPALLGSARELT